MSNHARRPPFRRRVALSREGRRHPKHYTADQLEGFLVGDGVRRHPTQLDWAAEAFVEIARQRRQNPDEVFSQVDQAVRERCGLGLPVAR